MTKNFFYSVIVFVIVFLLSIFISVKINDEKISEQKQKATNLVANIAFSIQRQLSASLSATSALAVLIRQNGRINNFEHLANEMLSIYCGISSLQLAPNGVVTEIYPIEGNENAKGNLLDDPKRKTEALAAIISGKLTLAGPYELKQGGIGVIGRFPVFLENRSKKEFWGFTIVLIRLNELLKNSDLVNLDKTYYNYKLTKVHPDSGKAYIFSTNNPNAEWNSPVEFSFLVPNSVWTLSIEPVNCWKRGKLNTLILLISSVVSILCASLVFIFLRHYYNNQITSRQLSEINATKDKFFTIIAHDLKNPLGNFKETTKLLAESYHEFSEEEKLEFLILMKESSNNIYALLENLLEWSRSQQGMIQFSPTDFDLTLTAKNTIEILKLSLEKKKISLEFKIEDFTIVHGDVNMITTVIRNLLSNAIKFTPENGAIVLSSAIQNNFVLVSIKDNGVGMSREIIDKLFKIEAHITSLGTNSESGTGLGLILCKEYINKHGGNIWVDSEEGSGSTFYFTLPLRSN